MFLSAPNGDIPLSPSSLYPPFHKRENGSPTLAVWEIFAAGRDNSEIYFLFFRHQFFCPDLVFGAAAGATPIGPANSPFGYRKRPRDRIITAAGRRLRVGIYAK